MDHQSMLSASPELIGTVDDFDSLLQSKFLDSNNAGACTVPSLDCLDYNSSVLADFMLSGLSSMNFVANPPSESSIGHPATPSHNSTPESEVQHQLADTAGWEAAGLEKAHLDVVADGTTRSKRKRVSGKETKSLHVPCSTTSQLQQLEEQLHQLTAEFTQLQMRNRRLKSRLQLLETVIPYKEHQLEALARSKPQQTTSVTHLGAPAGSPLQHVGCSAGDKSVPDLQTKTATQLPGYQPADSPVSQMDQSPSTKQATEPSGMPSLTTTPQASQSYVGPSTALARGSSSTERDARRFLCNFVREAASLVVAWETFPTLRVQEHMKVLGACMSAAAINTGAHPAALLMDSTQVNMQTGASDFPGQEMWVAVARQMNLTEAQLLACQEVLSLWQDRVHAALTDRRTLCEQLSNLSNQACKPCARYEELQLQVDEVVTKLADTFNKEKAAAVTVIDCMAVSVLELPQALKVFVASHPYVPDFLAIAQAAAAWAPKVASV